MTERYTLEYWKDELDEMWLEITAMHNPGKNIEQAVKESFLYMLSDGDRIKTATASDFKKLVISWLSNKKPEKRKAKLDRDGVNKFLK